jgi:hypothetical protein
MEKDSSNTLLEFNNETVQKEEKSEPSNLLYEYIHNNGSTNGHAEDGLTNGGEQEVDLLEGADVSGGDTSGGGDLLGGNDTQNNVEDSEDLLENSEPVISFDFGVTEDANIVNEHQPGKETQTRSRSNSENSEPEQVIISFPLLIP